MIALFLFLVAISDFSTSNATKVYLANSTIQGTGIAVLAFPRTTGIPVNEERTLETPPTRNLTITHDPLEINSNSNKQTNGINPSVGSAAIIGLEGNHRREVFDNGTISAEETGHRDAYSNHNYRDYSSAYNSHSSQAGVHGQQTYGSNVKPVKESVVYRDPNEHFHNNDVRIPQQNGYNDQTPHKHHRHHSQLHQSHEQQSNYGDHNIHNGHANGYYNNGHSHAYQGSYRETGFQAYHYDPAEVPRCVYSNPHNQNLSFCLEDHYYPTETIIWAIQNSEPFARRFLADMSYQSADNLVDGLTRAEEEQMTYSHYYGNSHAEHRQLDKYNSPFTGYSYNQDYYKRGGYICPSNIFYARPKRARNTYGKWKVIVNLEHPPMDTSGHGGHHLVYTQTLRLEQCIYSNAPCSYIDSHYHSRCLQKHNFKRLIAWTYEAGLHLDIFKLPVACSCHLQQPAHYYTPKPQIFGHLHGRSSSTGLSTYNQAQGHKQLITTLQQGKTKLINTLLG